MIERSAQRLQDILKSEQTISEVSKFAAWKNETGFRTGVYEKLVQLDELKEGQQLAFEVDLDLCSGCKACVTGCHSMNGLETGETWRAVGVLTLEKLFDDTQSTSSTVTLPVTTACHHCADPGCANGCPVLAYDKDPKTGIVRHLDDQCIGCQYCVLMCPYEVPQYSERLGIVRKCDLCANRLDAGEAPACVQSCPNEAIKVSVVDRAEIESRHQNQKGDSDSFLPDAPPSRLTVPTTQFKSRHFDTEPGIWRSAERQEPRPEPAHTPLAWMLPLSQASVGSVIASLFLSGPAATAAAVASLALMLLGLAWSVRHLGQPTRAWRAFLGWRRSWLSREMLAFGAYTTALGALVAIKWLPSIPLQAIKALEWVVPALGLLSVYTSVMIYSVTGRPGWRLKITASKFYSSCALIGSTAGLLCASAFYEAATIPVWAALTILFGFGKLSGEAQMLSRFGSSNDPMLRESATLLTGVLSPVRRRRTILCGIGLLGALLAPLFAAPVFAAIAFSVLLYSEYLERRLFFMSSVPFRMPRSLK